MARRVKRYRKRRERERVMPCTHRNYFNYLSLVRLKETVLCISMLGFAWTPENANADVVAPHQLGDVRVVLCCCICFYLFFLLVFL